MFPAYKLIMRYKFEFEVTEKYATLTMSAIIFSGIK